MKLDKQRVKYRMACKYLTMDELQRETGLSRATIYNVVGGKTEPLPDTLRRICRALECEPQDILEEVY